MVTSFGTPMLFLFQYVCQKYNFFSQKYNQDSFFCGHTVCNDSKPYLDHCAEV